MNTLMWSHPLTSSHVQTLSSWGYKMIAPISKKLACGDTGMAKMLLFEMRWIICCWPASFSRFPYRWEKVWGKWKKDLRGDETFHHPAKLSDELLINVFKWGNRYSVVEIWSLLLRTHCGEQRLNFHFRCRCNGRGRWNHTFDWNVDDVITFWLDEYCVY